METIVEKFVLQLEEQLAERHVAITLSREARAWLAAKGYDPVFGARPLGRVVQKDVRDPLTDEILFGTLEHGGTVTIGVADEHLTFSCEPRIRSGQSADQLPSERPSAVESPAAAGSDRHVPPADREQ
jgi:ATP-dependent Clp protease ATP-binding subunit ClpA